MPWYLICGIWNSNPLMLFLYRDTESINARWLDTIELQLYLQISLAKLERRIAEICLIDSWLNHPWCRTVWPTRGGCWIGQIPDFDAWGWIYNRASLACGWRDGHVIHLTWLQARSFKQSLLASTRQQNSAEAKGIGRSSRPYCIGWE